ncbi:hypothetical protein FRC00_006562 [Tulasnella sp. 408]|nr:hypothetical protein FRC00_006562 [Tulasnella sp. 408]
MFDPLSCQTSHHFEPLYSNPNSYGNEIRSQERSLAEGKTFGRSERTNHSKGINDLPLELFVLILDAALDEPCFQGGDYLSTLKTLAAVCRRWKSTIQNTPSFWTVIESTITPDEMHYMLRKSGKRNLTFRHPPKTDSAPDAFPTKRLDTSDFLGTASAHMSRCSSLSLAGKWCRQTARIVGSPAPVLREATVVATGNDFNECVILFDGQAGMLENLWLSRIPIRWDLGLPPKLRRVKISYDVASLLWIPHPRQVVSALSSCSGIEVFSISGEMGPSDWGHLEWAELGMQGVMVELPMLKELTIENMTIPGTAYILQYLSTPLLRNLKLTESLRPQADSLAPLLLPPSPVLADSIRDALVHCKKLTLAVQWGHYDLGIEGAEGHVYLSLRCRDRDEVTRWLVQEFVSELSSVPELKFEASSALPGPQLRSLPELLKALRNVARLECPCVGSAAAILVDHLAQPYQGSDGWRWHWPGLRHLRLHDADDWNPLALTALFFQRYAAPQRAGKDLSAGTPKWYPCSLATLQLGAVKSRHPIVFQAITRIVGEGVLEDI